MASGHSPDLTASIKNISIHNRRNLQNDLEEDSLSSAQNDNPVSLSVPNQPFRFINAFLFSSNPGELSIDTIHPSQSHNNNNLFTWELIITRLIILCHFPISATSFHRFLRRLSSPICVHWTTFECQLSTFFRFCEMFNRITATCSHRSVLWRIAKQWEISVDALNGHMMHNSRRRYSLRSWETAHFPVKQDSCTDYMNVEHSSLSIWNNCFEVCLHSSIV